MSAIGRKRTLISPNFRQFERPLSGKADIQLVLAKRAANDPVIRFLGILLTCKGLVPVPTYVLMVSTKFLGATIHYEKVHLCSLDAFARIGL